MNNATFTVIPKRKLIDMLNEEEASGNEYIEFVDYHDTGNQVFAVYLDKRHNINFGVEKRKG